MKKYTVIQLYTVLHGVRVRFTEVREWESPGAKGRRDNIN